jgi:hypothetical protein
MRKYLMFALIILSLLTLLMLPAASQEEIEVLDDQGFSKKQRPPAVFKHDEHNEKAEIEECNECHHIYENGEKLEDESSEDQLCSDCHSETDSGDQPRLLKAYHLNCKGCHQAAKKGPIMCGECHVR